MDTTSNAKSFVFPPPLLCASMDELRDRRASPWQKRTATRRRAAFLVVANFISILPIGFRDPRDFAVPYHLEVDPPLRIGPRILECLQLRIRRGGSTSR